jgi:hypothetical protein
MVLEVMISVLALDAAVEVPIGGLSPLAWVIIIALAGVIAATVPALWYRGNKIQDKMYEDLKICHEKRVQSEDDQLGLLKVLRLQMEASRGGKKR